MDGVRSRPVENSMKKVPMQPEATTDCPELVLAALEDATIELAFIKQLISTIAENAETIRDPEPVKPTSEELQ